jgi:hypothetical protein
MWIRLLGAAPRRDGSGRGAVASSYDSATCGVVVAWAPGLVVSVGVWGERAGRRPGCPTLATSSERRGAISAVCECGETEGGGPRLSPLLPFCGLPRGVATRGPAAERRVSRPEDGRHLSRRERPRDGRPRDAAGPAW